MKREDGAMPFSQMVALRLRKLIPRRCSQKDSSIYFCGEVLDYHAFTGGFNLTCAFSTGYTAGYFAAKNCSS